MSLVRVQPADWAGHRDLRLEALHSEPEAFSSRYAEEVRNDEAEWRARIDRITFWQAQIAGVPVGMAGLWEDPSPGGAPGDAGAACAHLIAMYVRSEARRRGIGARLVEAISREGSSRGYRRLLLHVASENAAARAFYANLGFVEIDAPPREPVQRCELAMARAVPPG